MVATKTVLFTFESEHKSEQNVHEVKEVQTVHEVLEDIPPQELDPPSRPEPREQTPLAKAPATQPDASEGAPRLSEPVFKLPVSIMLSSYFASGSRYGSSDCPIFAFPFSLAHSFSLLEPPKRSTASLNSKSDKYLPIYLSIYLFTNIFSFSFFASVVFQGYSRLGRGTNSGARKNDSQSIKRSDARKSYF